MKKSAGLQTDTSDKEIVRCLQQRRRREISSGATDPKDSWKGGDGARRLASLSVRLSDRHAVNKPLRFHCLRQGSIRSRLARQHVAKESAPLPSYVEECWKI